MKYKTRILLITILMCTTYTFGQVVPPPIPPPPPPGLPIDGGILFLVASGIILGVKKLKKN